jgi:hypothetical protein
MWRLLFSRIWLHAFRNMFNNVSNEYEIHSNCSGQGRILGYVEHCHVTLSTVESREFLNRRIDSYIYIYIYIFFFFCCHLGVHIWHSWNALFHFSFLIVGHSVGLLGLGIGPVARPVSTHTTVQAHIKSRQTMPLLGFEPTIPAFEKAKTVHALDRAATANGLSLIYIKIFCNGEWKLWNKQFRVTIASNFGVLTRHWS